MGKIKAKLRQHPSTRKAAKKFSGDDLPYSALMSDEEGNTYEAQSDNSNTLNTFVTNANKTQITGLCNDPRTLIYDSGSGGCDPIGSGLPGLQTNQRDVDPNSQLTVTACGFQNNYGQTVTQPFLISSGQTTCAPPSGPSGKTEGIIAASTIGGLVLLALGVYGIFKCCKKKPSVQEELSQIIIHTPSTNNITKSEIVNSSSSSSGYGSLDIQSGEYKAPTNTK